MCSFRQKGAKGRSIRKVGGKEVDRVGERCARLKGSEICVKSCTFVNSYESLPFAAAPRLRHTYRPETTGVTSTGLIVRSQAEDEVRPLYLTSNCDQGEVVRRSCIMVFAHVDGATRVYAMLSTTSFRENFAATTTTKEIVPDESRQGCVLPSEGKSSIPQGVAGCCHQSRLRPRSFVHEEGRNESPFAGCNKVAQENYRRHD